jgi:hypothetical protein
MNKILFVIAFIIPLASCQGNNVKHIDITKKVEPVKILHPPDPNNIRWEKVKIRVITPDIMRDLLSKLSHGELDKSDLVFVALTPSGYKHLAVNLAELKRYISDQKSIIGYYQNTVPGEIFLPNNDKSK